MIIENVLKIGTALKLFQFMIDEFPSVVLSTNICSTGGEYDFQGENNKKNIIVPDCFRIYKKSTSDSGIVMSNIQPSRDSLFSLNTMFYHHNDNDDKLIIYGDEINHFNSEHRYIENDHNFEYYTDPVNLQKTIDYYGNSTTYALVLNSLCKDINLKNMKFHTLKISQFLNDCLSDHWYTYYKGM